MNLGAWPFQGLGFQGLGDLGKRGVSAVSAVKLTMIRDKPLRPMYTGIEWKSFGGQGVTNLSGGTHRSRVWWGWRVS